MAAASRRQTVHGSVRDLCWSKASRQPPCDDTLTPGCILIDLSLRDRLGLRERFWIPVVLAVFCIEFNCPLQALAQRRLWTPPECRLDLLIARVKTAEIYQL